MKQFARINLSSAALRRGILVSSLVLAAVFFVSIGLLVDPAQCVQNLPAILVVTLVVDVGKFLNCTAAALVAGQDLKSAVQMGFGLDLQTARFPQAP